MITSKIDGNEFVQIKVPGADPFWMAKKQELECDNYGHIRFTNVTEEESLKILHKRYGKDAFIWRDIVCLQMRNYAQEKLGKLTDIKEVEKFFGIFDFDKDEFLHTCNGSTGVRWDDGASAGAFTVSLFYAPSSSSSGIGFRCCLPCESEDLKGETPKEKVTPQLPDELKEQLAAVQHQIWAHWMKYMFGKCIGTTDKDKDSLIPIGSMIISKGLADRWSCQANTKYENLTEKEKASDREQVDKFWGLIFPHKNEIKKDSPSKDKAIGFMLNTLRIQENVSRGIIHTNQTAIKELGKDQKEKHQQIDDYLCEVREQLSVIYQKIKKLEESIKEDIPGLMGVSEKTVQDLTVRVEKLEEIVKHDIPGLMGVSAKDVDDHFRLHHERLKKLEKHHEDRGKPDNRIDPFAFEKGVKRDAYIREVRRR